MSKFKFGERVVAITNHSIGAFKKGDEFIVDGFSCCPNCGVPTIRLKELDGIGDVRCGDCGFLENIVREHYIEQCFEKIISIAETTEYKLKVTIPELTKIEEYQNH